MTKDQKCIVAMYKILDEITEKAKNHDTSLFRLFRSKGMGADMYQGLPPICRIFDGLSSDHAEALSEAFREAEKEQAQKLASIKEDYLKNSDVIFSEYLRNRIAKGLEVSNDEIRDLLKWSGDEEFVSVGDIRG